MVYGAAGPGEDNDRATRLVASLHWAPRDLATTVNLYGSSTGESRGCRKAHNRERSIATRGARAEAELVAPLTLGYRPILRESVAVERGVQSVSQPPGGTLDRTPPTRSRQRQTESSPPSSAVLVHGPPWSSAGLGPASATDRRVVVGHCQRPAGERSMVEVLLSVLLCAPSKEPTNSLGELASRALVGRPPSRSGGARPQGLPARRTGARR